MTKLVPQIGLTGSIGSGKSAVARLFAEWGSSILDADVIARSLLEQQSPLRESLIAQFGPQITRPDGRLDRFALRSIIFSDLEAKKFVESLLHPEIKKQLFEKSHKLIESGVTSVTLVIPLLFESNSYSYLTHIVLVSSPKRLCIERACKRDSCSPKLIEKIYDSQISSKESEKMTNLIIKNEGSLEELRTNARIVFDKIHGL